MDGASEIVIEEFLGTGLAINSSQHTRIRRAIEHPFYGWQIGEILLVADIPYPDIDSEGTQWLEIGLAPLADEAVDAYNLDTEKMLEKPACYDGSGKATDSGNEEVHEKKGVRRKAEGLGEEG